MKKRHWSEQDKRSVGDVLSRLAARALQIHGELSAALGGPSERFDPEPRACLSIPH